MPERLAWRCVTLLAGIVACLVLAGLPIVLPDGDDCCVEAVCCCSETVASSCCASGRDTPSGPRIAAACACGHASAFVHLPTIRALPAIADVGSSAPAAVRPLVRRADPLPLGRFPEPEPPVPRRPLAS